VWTGGDSRGPAELTANGTHASWLEPGPCSCGKIKSGALTGPPSGKGVCGRAYGVPTSPQSGIHPPFSDPGFVLALAGIWRRWYTSRRIFPLSEGWWGVSLLLWFRINYYYARIHYECGRVVCGWTYGTRAGAAVPHRATCGTHHGN